MSKSSLSLARLFRASGYSLAGLRAAWRHEAAFRLEVLLTLVLLPLAFVVGRSEIDYALLIASWLLVLVTELLNSAIEALTDRVGDDPHELSGRAKDLGSAAVMISIIVALTVWGGIALARFGA